MGVLNSKTFATALSAVASSVDVECDELGGSVRLKRLTAGQGMNLGKIYDMVPKGRDGQPRNVDDMADFFVRLVSMSVVDDAGEAYLSNDEGRFALAGLSLGTISKLGTEAMVLNNMAESTDAKKNKVKTSTGTSTTKTTPSLSDSAGS